VQVPLLANQFTTVYQSPDPERVYAYTPGLVRLESGRLVATMDQGGPGVRDLPGPKGWRGEGPHAWQGLIFTSDDRGQTWTRRAIFPFMHARPFIAGRALYVLGHAGDLAIVRSDDRGETWSEPAFLTEGESWHQSACNVHYVNGPSAGRLYLVMEKRARHTHDGWPVSDLAPVMMRADVTADLTRRESWALASELVIGDHVARVDWAGIPFWPLGPTIAPSMSAPGTRPMHPIGWLETNVIQFLDPDHVWHDPTGRTFHLWMRAHTGSTHLACIAKVVEDEDGNMTTTFERSPAGVPMLYVPCPGGHMRFHILYDEVTRLYWLLSSLPTDSMHRPDRLPATRYGLPNNERHVLALHYSRNCVDWWPAGLVARGNSPREARHYASMCVDGDDLHVLSRSGDRRAHSAHDGNLITFHTVKGFRKLAHDLV
jgi:hypothetical protein